MLVTAVTSAAPRALATWTVKVPTPPPAPLTSTRSPGRSWPWSRSAWSAVHPAAGTAAASSNDRLAGFGTKAVPATSSANAPWCMP